MSDAQEDVANKPQRQNGGRPPARKCLTDALRIAVNEPAEGGEKKVRLIANKLVEKALSGDLEATKIVFDRLEGKAPQPVVGEEDSPIVHALKVRFV